MTANIDELDRLLEEMGSEFVDATEAEKRGLEAEFPLAKATLQALVKKINERIARTERILIESVPIAIDSPVISLIEAALKKRKYQVATSGKSDYTQFIIRW